MLELHLYPQPWPSLAESKLPLGWWIHFGVDVEVEVISVISRPSAPLLDPSDLNQAQQFPHHPHFSSLLFS